jgi:PKD repeat protein
MLTILNFLLSDYEGPCKRGSMSECSVPGSGKMDPFYYYLHTAASEGGAVTGAAFPPTGLWPAKYKYLFIDFIFGGIYNLVEDKDRACRTCKPPIPAFRNETFHKHPNMVDMFFGPYKSTQALYIVSRSEGQNVRRIRYTASTNKAPVAVASASKMTVKVNEVIAFKGSDSSDADGDKITFLWNFGNGQTSKDANPNHSYTKQGQYTVTLTVTDSKSQVSQTFLTIKVGASPTAAMESPTAGSKFSVGQKLRLKGSAKDSQGKSLATSQIFWEVRQRHADHFHPFLDRTAGNDFDLFPAPEPEDFNAATNSFLEVIMYAVDSNGLTTTISRNIEPKKVLIDIDSKPQKLKVLVDEFDVVTPSTITSWEGHNLRLDVKDQGSNIFSKWSIGGSRKTTFKVPKANATNPKIIANFNTGPTAPRAPQTGVVPSTPRSSPTGVAPSPRAAPTSTLPALSSVIKDCTSTNPCKRCQGDCNTDDDCEGKLVCFNKNAGLPGNVPSCSGVDLSRTDWCVLP